MKTYIHVGAGGWGRTWLRGTIPQNETLAKCVAIVDTNPQVIQESLALFDYPEEMYFLSLAEAFQKHSVDFVTIASSIPSHPAVVKTALAHGCHILMEKPLADTMQNSAALYRAVKESDRKCAVTMSHRYGQDKQTFLDLMRRKPFGDMNYLVARLAIARARWPVAVRELPLAFIDGGVHNFDMVRAFTGSEPKVVYAKAWQFDPGDNKGGGTCTAGFITMENGVQVAMESNYGGAYHHNGWGHEHFRAECAHASVTLDNRTIIARSSEGYPHATQSEISLLPGEDWGHALLFRQFIDWLNGGEPMEVTVEDNIYSTAFMFAALESYRTGLPIQMAEFLQRHEIPAP